MIDSLTNAPEYTVSDISLAVKRIVEGEFEHVRVRGEVSRLSRPASGHIYFDLKDENAVLAAVAWKGTAQRWRFQPEQGLEVIVTGRLTTFPGQSKYQIIVENVEPAGVGALMALLEERRKKLLAEGLFDPARKKKLPFLPRVIGVVTSPSGAVIRDILHRLADRFPTHVVVWPVRVQGEGCAAEVAAAITGFNALITGGAIARPDLLIVARGGGSVEDLWGFNEEIVVRAVAASAIPIISAIGHETDTTLIDYAADVRAPTPTGAAEIAVPVRADLIAGVEDYGSRLRSGMRRLLQSLRDRMRAATAGLPRPSELSAIAGQRLDLAIGRLQSARRDYLSGKALALARITPLLSPLVLGRQIAMSRQRLSALGARQSISLGNWRERRQSLLEPLWRRLERAGRQTVADKSSRLAASAKALSILDPKSVLGRGFALVTDGSGQIIRQAQGLEDGDNVVIEFQDGKVDATIGKSADKPPKSRVRKSDPEGGDQSSLF